VRKIIKAELIPESQDGVLGRLLETLREEANGPPGQVKFAIFRIYIQVNQSVLQCPTHIGRFPMGG